MINKYQIYHLYKVLSGLKTAKRFTNKVYKDLTTKSVKDILEEDFYYTPNVDKSANVFIDLVNSINSGQFTVKDFAISIVNEFMITEKFPTLLSCGRVDNRQKFFIFKKRKEIIEQSEYLKQLVEDKNKGLFQFSSKYTLFGLASDQTNEIYKLIRDKIVTSEFYIRGYEAKKFIIDESKIQDTAYMRFVWLTKIVLNLKR